MGDCKKNRGEAEFHGPNRKLGKETADAAHQVIGLLIGRPVAAAIWRAYPPYNTVFGYRFLVEKTRIVGKLKLIAIAKSFFRLIIFILGAQRAVPLDHGRARQAVPLQNEITFGNRYKFVGLKTGLGTTIFRVEA